MTSKERAADGQVSEDELKRLTDALVDDILETSDDEIVREVAEDLGDPDEIDAQVKLLFEQAVIEAGKERLAAARARIKERESSQSDVVELSSLSLEEKRALVKQLFAKAAALGTPVTVAARNEGELQESDLDAALQACAELGLTANDDQLD